MITKKIKDKLDFQDNFILFNLDEIKDDRYIFDEELFFPIYKKDDNSTCLITINQDLIKNNINNSHNLEVIFKYINNIDKIYYCEDELYFSLIKKENVEKEIVSKDSEDFFRKILQNASRKGASDIHLIWEETGVRIKFRIDGIPIIQGSLISFDLGEAFKNLCVVKANESEYEKNEVAGKFKMLIDQKVKEYRLSIAPTAKGYAIVIRQASYLDINTKISDWGYTDKAIKMIREVMKNNFGMILVTGPTGSGKSTLLYSLIIEEKWKNKIIKTVEDPVEIEINGVDQIQVNTKGDKESHLTFAKAIKVFLRQDPDTIVVGEIRDLEVAITAFTAAKTGHLCLSTLHTNDVESSISRLFDLGIEQIDIEDSLRCIVSQRLVPKLCDNCKIKHVENNGNIYYTHNPDGCEICNDNKTPGYNGRVPITEIALMDNSRLNFKKENFISYYSLEENILDLIEIGKIDIEEANKHIEINDLKSLNKRKEINNIWNKIINNKEKEEYLLPYYQPIVDKNRLINGYEVFGRLKNFENKLYNPGEYIPILKEMKLYNIATNYLFNKSFEENKLYGLNFFFNIDHENISNKDFLENILNKINDKMSTSMSNYILETNYDYEHFIEDVITIKKNGLMISLDNFDGSAKAIQKIKKHNLSIDYVKTYKDFIIGFSNNEKWVDYYIKILKEMNTKIIVTNIETIEIYEKLKNKYGDIIDYYQGYFFGKPIRKIEVI